MRNSKQERRLQGRKVKRPFTIEQFIKEANYIIDTGCTIREAAKHFGVSKSTIHKDIQFLSKQLGNEMLAQKVQAILDHHAEIRSMNGGIATKIRWAARRADKLAEEIESGKYRYHLHDEKGSRVIHVSSKRAYKTKRFILSDIRDKSTALNEYELWSARGMLHKLYGYCIELPGDICITKDDFDRFSRTESKVPVGSLNPIPYIKLSGKLIKGPEQLESIPFSKWHDYLTHNGYQLLNERKGYIKDIKENKH